MVIMTFRVMTAEVKKKLVELVGSGEWKKHAAEKVGIDDSTFFRAMQKDPEFKAAIVAAEGRLESEMLNIVVTEARKEPKWAAWMLERRFGDRWGKKDKIHLTSGDEVPFGFEE